MSHSKVCSSLLCILCTETVRCPCVVLTVYSAFHGSNESITVVHYSEIILVSLRTRGHNTEHKLRHF